MASADGRRGSLSSTCGRSSRATWMRSSDSTDGSVDQTIRRRDLGRHRELDPDEVARLTCVDEFNRVAYVVEHDGEIVGVGRYDRLERALLVGGGLCRGRRVPAPRIGFDAAGAVGQTVKRAGIGEFQCLRPRRDVRMLAVFHGAGFPVTETESVMSSSS